MTLNDIKTVLTATGYKFAHYAWSRSPAGDYGVYAEDGANDLNADGEHAEKALQGTVDYFTRDDTGTPKATIEAALEGLNVPWYLNTIQYEDETGYIHYEWVFEVV